MAAARGCSLVFSFLLRLPAHSCAQPLSMSRFRGERLTISRAVRHRCRCLSSSADNGAAAVASPLSSCLLAHTLCCPSNAGNGHQQLEARTRVHSSDTFSSGRGAALPPFFCGTFFFSRRSVTTMQPEAPVSAAPAAPLPRESPKVTAVEAAASRPDIPTLIHHSIKSEEQLLARMSALKTYLLAANWQDYLSFVLNSAFWEAEMHLLETEVGPFKDRSSLNMDGPVVYLQLTHPETTCKHPNEIESAQLLRECFSSMLHDRGSVTHVVMPADVKGLLRDLRRLFDLMAQASDVRDHINQIMELGSRSTGLAGTGLNAADKLENFEDHVQAAVAEYDRLMKEYPEYCSLVDDCLGSGLAMMRQKQRFTFSALHRFFY